MPEKHIESLSKAIKKLQIADHISSVTYPLIKDKQLLIKSIESIYDSLMHNINAILQYDYLWKKIKIYKDPKDNFSTFSRKSAPRYNISPTEVQQIVEFLKIIRKHKNSPLEFSRKEKLVIMSDNLKTQVIDIEFIKTHIILSKAILKKTNTYFNRNL